MQRALVLELLLISHSAAAAFQLNSLSVRSLLRMPKVGKALRVGGRLPGPFARVAAQRGGGGGDDASLESLTELKERCK